MLKINFKTFTKINRDHLCPKSLKVKLIANLLEFNLARKKRNRFFGCQFCPPQISKTNRGKHSSIQGTFMDAQTRNQTVLRKGLPDNTCQSEHLKKTRKSKDRR